MSITQTMSTMADAASARYSLLVEGWRALYSRALDDPKFGSAEQVRGVIEQAYRMAQIFMIAENTDIADALDEIAEQALTATRAELSVTDSDEFPEAISEHVSAFEAHLSSALFTQIERDILTLKKGLQQTILAVTIAARAQRLPLRTALIQHRVAQNTDPQFSFQDRRSMKWPSLKYIRTIWRHDLLALYNDVVMLELADHGVDTAQIRHDDPNSEAHGTQVSLLANTTLPSHADIKDEFFHPNANAVMARYA